MPAVQDVSDLSFVVSHGMSIPLWGSRGLSPQPGESGFAGGGLARFGTIWHFLSLFDTGFGRAPGMR